MWSLILGHLLNTTCMQKQNVANYKPWNANQPKTSCNIKDFLCQSNFTVFVNTDLSILQHSDAQSFGHVVQGQATGQIGPCAPGFSLHTWIDYTLPLLPLLHPLPALHARIRALGPHASLVQPDVSRLECSGPNAAPAQPQVLGSGP